jgi:uracil-DNA glycosylase
MDAERTLQAEIAGCRQCASALAVVGPQPIRQFNPNARILIVGQAPAARVQLSAIPWLDPAGDRLREWTRLSLKEFYDPLKVALMPMTFCAEEHERGRQPDAHLECGPLWQSRLLAQLPADLLILLVGSWAHGHYLPQPAARSLTENVRAFRSFGPSLFPLPHPSWSHVGWERRNPWFARDVLPALAKAVRARLPVERKERVASAPARTGA